MADNDEGHAEGDYSDRMYQELRDVNLDFGERLDKALTMGFSDEEILMQLGPENHELLVALLRVRKRAAKPMPLPETNAKTLTVGEQEIVIVTRDEYERLIDWVTAANALQVQADESDPIISDDHS
jgi:hypothetical protein